MGENVDVSQKSFSPKPFREPENMITVELNRNEHLPGETHGLRIKKKISFKFSHITKSITSTFFIVGIFSLATVILLIPGYIIFIKANDKNVSEENNLTLKFLLSNQDRIQACKLSKTFQDCCYIFLKTDILYGIEKCTVQKVLNLFLQYELQINKRSKRQNYEEYPLYEYNRNYGYNNVEYQQENPLLAYVPDASYQKSGGYFNSNEMFNTHEPVENYFHGATNREQNGNNFETSESQVSQRFYQQDATSVTDVFKKGPPEMTPTQNKRLSTTNSRSDKDKEDYLINQTLHSSTILPKLCYGNNCSSKVETRTEFSTITNKIKFDLNTSNRRISQGNDFEKQLVEIQQPSQNNKQAVNPCFYSFPPSLFSPNRASGFDSNQIFTMIPPQHQSLYIINPPLYSYLPFQYQSYNYQNPQVINRSPITVTSNSGQYYMCNPISSPSNNIANLPGVEIRRVSDQFTLQDMVESVSKTSSSNKTRAALNCPIGEQSCSDGSKCIHIKQLCDNEVDCNDGSDEENCSCKNRVWEMRWCDGYFDCPNGEDENDCFECSEDEYSCDDWSKLRRGTCIPLHERCDGIKQCEITGKDEEDCSVLTDHLGQHTLYKISNAVGFLHRNYKGKWYPTCFGGYSFAVEVCKTEAGPSEILPRIHLMSTSDNYIGPFINVSPSNHLVLEKSCLDNKAAFVECPPMFCGLRLIINNPFRSSEVDTSAEEMLNHLQRLGSSNEQIVGGSRIVGGKPSQPAAWPWVVSIYKNGFFHCGGVLINELWIVTAAHCVDKYWFFYYEIQAGALRRFSYSPMEQSRWAAVVVPHGDYSKKTLKNDVALMKLSKPLRFNRYVRPICLPSETTAGEDYLRGPKPNSVCVTVGWGATVEHGTDPDHLREVEIPILPHCKHIEDQEGDEICAGLLEGGKDACQGDSGGPLMCQNEKNRSQWYLAGIVSHGEGCARPNEPGVYTKVSKYVGWIAENVNSNTIGRLPLQKCPGYVCKGTKRCLPKKRHCDKVVDCLLGDDELNCWQDGDGHSSLFGSHVVGSQPKNMLPQLLDLYNRNNDSNDNQNKSITEDTDVKKTKRLDLPKTFTCKKMLQLIPFEEKCNKIVNCEDGTDESDCLCVDFLKIFDQDAICDGITDCKDLSDETDCLKCQLNQYLCRLSQKCIPLSKRCDGKFDCFRSEDEWDCVALTDGKTLTLDSELRPQHSSKGIITINRSGVWRPLCNVTSERASIAADVCNLLGFDGYRVYHKFSLTDKPLNVEEEGPTCEGLFVGCSETTRRDNVSAGEEPYTLPWNALIYSDGEFRCTGTIIDSHWIISTKACFLDTSLKNGYIAILVGKGKTHVDIEGPHEQVVHVTSVIPVENSRIIVLHTKQKITFSRYVKPTQLTVNTMVSSKEKCLAIGVKAEIISFELLHSIKKCTPDFRCFKSDSCKTTKSPIKWSGMIICDSRDGWYPAAAFKDVNGSCGFYNQEFASINKLLVKKALEHGSGELIVPPKCNGLRCSLGQCIIKRKMCDGILDCRNGEDENFKCGNLETDCHLPGGCRNSSSCKQTEFKCRNGKCIPKTSFCDNINDCGDFYDEPATCSCKTYMERVHSEKICDGTVNCWDRSDEDPKRCRCQFPTNITCGQTKQCISKEMICDGFTDCPDGEDEHICYSLRTNFSSIHGGEVMMRTAGVWHFSCFQKNLTTTDLEEICTRLGFSGGSAKQITMPEDADNVTVPVRDRFDVVWIRRSTGNKLKLRLRTGNEPYVKFMKNSSCHKLYIECL